MDRRFMILLFLINLIGTIYGFYWYKNQLKVTEIQWLIFVPDSPTASLFFTGVLWLYIWRQRNALLEAFASVTLFKYGIWAVVMIIWGGVLDSRPFLEALNWQHWMLIGSHIGMALQAVFYAPFYTYRHKELIVVAAWTLLNDFLDYRMDIHPWLHPDLEVFDHIVGYFTVLLSLTTLTIFATLSIIDSKDRKWEFVSWPKWKKH